MNYFALAGGILSAVIALYCLTRLVAVASTKAVFLAPLASFIFMSLFTAGFGTLAAWLFSVAS